MKQPADNHLQLDRSAKHFVNPETRFKLILSIYLILIKNGKVLLLRRANTGYEDGKYGLPSGHADGNETSQAATCREALEEVGVKVGPDDLKFIHAMHRLQNDERVDLFFAVDKWQGEPKNMEPEKCDDLSWFPLDDLPANTIPYIRQALESYQQGIYYSEFWEGNT
ncbi:MAG TPA: NUDIX domain-containing protein [Puia sp.]|jgi:ADP-ribose pyrophosphatase YjhB (NUDIX family)|nr:NUDIX domain-containing protein [Puia sp.]